MIKSKIIDHLLASKFNQNICLNSDEKNKCLNFNSGLGW
jgi:hypothetical protein